jgi:DNA-binding LacI/PurR family transcriptional regulator
MRIEDIAKEAGVSIATVSRVLNTPGIVKPETRDRVLAVVEAHEYVPDSLARGLMTKRSRTVGVLIISISNAYYMEITEAIQRRLREAGFMMLLGATDDSSELEKRYLLDFASRRVDGIIVIDASAENYDSGFFAREADKLPLVLVHSNAAIDVASRASSGSPIPHPAFGEVFLDQRSGMRQAMEHLWALGHRDILFLRGKKGFSYDLKEAAYIEWLRERGVAPDPRYILRVDEGNTEDAIPLSEEAVKAALGSGLPVSALFACNDLQACGAVSAAIKCGKRIPEDLSIVSHDDTILAVSGRVQLTAVNLKMRELGLAAAELLLRSLASAAPLALPTRIEPELVVRASTAKLAAQPR